MTTPTQKSRFAAVWFTLRMIEVRLRFIAVLVAIGLVIGYWDTIQNYWDRYTKPAVSTASNVASDSEFYCPMDPSVIRDSLEPNGPIPKCPICGMPLSLAQKRCTDDLAARRGGARQPFTQSRSHGRNSDQRNWTPANGQCRFALSAWLRMTKAISHKSLVESVATSRNYSSTKRSSEVKEGDRVGGDIQP